MYMFLTIRVKSKKIISYSLGNKGFSTIEYEIIDYITFSSMV